MTGTVVGEPLASDAVSCTVPLYVPAASVAGVTPTVTVPSPLPLRGATVIQAPLGVALQLSVSEPPLVMVIDRVPRSACPTAPAKRRVSVLTTRIGRATTTRLT